MYLPTYISFCFAFLCFFRVTISATTVITKRVTKIASNPTATVEAMIRILSEAVGEDGDSTGVDSTGVKEGDSTGVDSTGVKEGDSTGVKATGVGGGFLQVLRDILSSGSTSTQTS